MTSTRELNVTADELLVLLDRIKYDDSIGRFKEIAPPLILKLGSAFEELCGETVKASGDVPLQITQAEAWLLRERMTIKDRTDDSPRLGISFLRKIYAILLSFESEVDLTYGAVNDKTYNAALKRKETLYSDDDKEASHA